MNEIIQESLNESMRKLSEFTGNPSNITDIAQAASTMAGALKEGKKIISCGNGGSLSDAAHFAEELTGRFRNDRAPLPAIAINDPAYITCVGNDYSFDDVYSRYVQAVGNKGDVLLAISTSGSSKNILNAVQIAKGKGMVVIGLTSNNGNELAKSSDVTVCAPVANFSDRIQEIHIKVIHIMVQLIEEYLIEE